MVAFCRLSARAPLSSMRMPSEAMKETCERSTMVFWPLGTIPAMKLISSLSTLAVSSRPDSAALVTPDSSVMAMDILGSAIPGRYGLVDMEGDERKIVVERPRAGFPAHGLKQALRFRKAGQRRVQHVLEEI